MNIARLISYLLAGGFSMVAHEVAGGFGALEYWLLLALFFGYGIALAVDTINRF